MPGHRAAPMSERTVTMPPYDCPVCQYHMDAATSTMPVPRAPQAGDITVCAKCGELLIFDENMKAREMDLKDMLQVSPEGQQQLAVMQALIRSERPLG